MAEEKLGFLGMAHAKQEGDLTNWETGVSASPAERIAYEAARKRTLEAMRIFESNMRSTPDVISPSWVSKQIAAIHDMDDEFSNGGDARRHLRDLVLFRISTNGISDPNGCAALLMGKDEPTFSWGW